MLTYKRAFPLEDSATGLTYMQARYYDPVIGRFLSNDPVGFIASGYDPRYVNRYAYAANEPINNTDPTGEACAPCAIVVWNLAREVGKSVGRKALKEFAKRQAKKHAPGITASTVVVGTIAIMSDESTDGETDSNSETSGSTETEKNDTQLPNTQNPASALDSIESEKKGKDKGRPSLQDPESDWHEAKKRPSSSPIDSTRRSRDRARKNDYMDDWEHEDYEDGND